MRKKYTDKFINFLWVHGPTDPFPVGALAPTAPGKSAPMKTVLFQMLTTLSVKKCWRRLVDTLPFFNFNK